MAHRLTLVTLDLLLLADPWSTGLGEVHFRSWREIGVAHGLYAFKQTYLLPLTSHTLELSSATWLVEARGEFTASFIGISRDFPDQ